MTKDVNRKHGNIFRLNVNCIKGVEKSLTKYGWLNNINFQQAGCLSDLLTLSPNGFRFVEGGYINKCNEQAAQRDGRKRDQTSSIKGHFKELKKRGYVWSGKEVGTPGRTEPIYGFSNAPVFREDYPIEAITELRVTGLDALKRSSLCGTEKGMKILKKIECNSGNSNRLESNLINDSNRLESNLINDSNRLDSNRLDSNRLDSNRLKSNRKDIYKNKYIENKNLENKKNSNPKSNYLLNGGDSFRGDPSQKITFFVFGLLNKYAGKDFEPEPQDFKNIGYLLSSGKYSVSDFDLVIQRKCIEWKGKGDLDNNLNPKTLFKAGNFERYINAFTEFQRMEHRKIFRTTYPEITEHERTEEF